MVAAGTSLGVETITVTTPGGSTPSGSQFTVVPPVPVVISFLPGSGPVGTTVTITGSALTGTTAVTFGSTAATNVTVISDTSVTAKVGPGTTLGGETITVTTPGGSTPSGSQFTVVPPVPVVTSFSPGSGPVGTTVTITGSALTGTTAVTFGSTAATNVTVISDTSVTAMVAAGTSLGVETITVTTPGGSTPSGSQFTVVPPVPVVTSFSPGSGPVGTIVTITGSGLMGATEAAFNGTPAVYTVDSDIQITATIPAGATTGMVSVTTPGGTGNGNSFTVVLVPVITSVTPDQGSVGVGVAIAGSGFSGATAVSFNGTGATFTVLSDSLISTSVPAGATTGTIVVTAPGGSAISSLFSVVAPGAPIITSISPSAGAPGAVVIITGANLDGVTAVSFNGTYAIFTVNGAGTQITATIPTGANSGPITVDTPQGNATSLIDFTNTSAQGASASASTSSNSKCGNGIGAFIGLLLLTAVLRRLRLRDQP